MIKIQFRQPAILYIDNRVTLTRNDLLAIKAHIRKRIFQDGMNADGKQMERAKSYQSPNNLYRFLTGDLFETFDIQAASGVILMTLDGYPDVVLNVLEDRYGRIFQFSKSDIEFIDRMVAAKLNVLGEDVSDSAKKALKEKREKERKKEEESLIAENESYEIERAEKLLEEATPEIVSTGNPGEEDAIINTPPPKAADRSKIVTGTFQLQYDSQVSFSAEELTLIANQIKTRINIQNLDVNGSTIPRFLKRFIDSESLASIRVTQNKSKGILTMSVRYITPSLEGVQIAKVKIFGWSNSEVAFVNDLVDEKIALQGLQKTVSTKRLN